MKSKGNTIPQFTKPVSILDQMRAMKIGQVMFCPIEVAKVTTLRSSAPMLKREGFAFEISEKGLTSGCYVKRIEYVCG